MKKLSLIVASLLVVTCLLGACTRQQYGTVAGGVVGGVVGNAVTGGSAVGTGIGAVGGALVGNELAK